MSEAEGQAKRPIIVIKKKKAGHGGHHGGAWKVAYADFVTAMMALFIVLWLMSADEDTKKMIAAYFNNPSGPGTMSGTASAGSGNALEVPKDDMEHLRDKIQKALTTIPNFRNLKDHVEITITSDGLRIELLETEAGMFFESGRARPTPTGAELLIRLAGELSQLPNTILIEGHTDSKPFAGDGSYTNWELSADRANAARRLMQEHGIKQEQVGQVRGYGDRQLRKPDEPDSPANRRVTVIVQYMAPAKTEGKEAAKPEGHGDPPKAEPAKSGGHDAPPAKSEPAKAPAHH